MRHGVALDLHATATRADEVSWRHVRAQALAAEQLGFDLVVLPDHLSYHAAATVILPSRTTRSAFARA